MNTCQLHILVQWVLFRGCLHVVDLYLFNRDEPQKNAVNMQQHINNCGKYHSDQYRIWTNAGPLLRVSASPYNQLFEQNEQIGRGCWTGRGTSMDILVNELSMSVTIGKIPHWVTINGCTCKRTFQNTGEQLSSWTTANTKEHWLLGN